MKKASSTLYEVKRSYLALTLVVYFLSIMSFSLYKLEKAIVLPKLELSEQDTKINVHEKIYHLLSMGHNRLIVAMLWIKTLMDSDHEHYKGGDLKNWIYLRFKTILSLDPNFKEAYQMGALYLSVVKDDVQAAKEIYDRAIKLFPTDFRLSFEAGIFYATDLEDFKTAYRLLNLIKFHPKAPAYFPSLVSKLRYEFQHNLNDIFQLTLAQFEKSPKESPIRKKLAMNLYSIKAEIDLTCLNSNKKNCSKKDFLGDDYLFINGHYKANRPWKKFKFERRKKGGD